MSSIGVTAKVRYLETTPRCHQGSSQPGALPPCGQRVAATDLDLLVYGGIARDAFEPATAPLKWPDASERGHFMCST